MKDFIEKINSNYGVDKTAAEELLNNAEIIHIPKHSYLVEYGGYNDSFYIVRDGILRAFRSPSDKDLTLWFAFAGDMVVDMFCYFEKKKSLIGIEAETDVSVFAISKTKLEQVCNSSVSVANTVRHIFERHAFVFEGNILSLWDCDSGMERYLSLLKRHPELLQNVPLKKLASYLSVTPQSLSRIRANLKM